MVNEEVIKSFENKESKGYNSDDDKKSGNSKNNSKIKNKSKLNESTNFPEKNIKLPKVNKKILNLNTNINFHNFLNSPYEVKNFGFYKTKNDNNNLLNINEDRNNKKDKNNLDNIQMNLTMPNNN